MNNNCAMNKRRTISINHDIYIKLRELGTFGESFNDVLERIIDYSDEKFKVKKNETG